MGRPMCPMCHNPLTLKTYSHKSDKMLRIPDLRNDYWVCDECKKHWLRGAAIMKVTARDNKRPAF